MTLIEHNVPIVRKSSVLRSDTTLNVHTRLWCMGKLTIPMLWLVC